MIEGQSVVTAEWITPSTEAEKWWFLNVNPGTARATEVRKLADEALSEMPRRVRYGVTVVEHVTHPWLEGKWARCYRTGRNNWRVVLARICLFLPVGELKRLLKHEFIHAYGVRRHGQEFKRMAVRFGAGAGANCIAPEGVEEARRGYYLWRREQKKDGEEEGE